MNLQAYLAYFESILQQAATAPQAPYDDPDYLDYTKLNFSRMNRWFKTGQLAAKMLDTVGKINQPQHWFVITEPWCGDAAHNIPFIEMIARQNPLISVSYVLRDSPPCLIDQYLTNGTKSIPKLIIRDVQGKDLGIWGPRPAGCQEMYASLQKENAPFEKIKMEIQNWYNANKGVAIQEELIGVITQTIQAT